MKNEDKIIELLAEMVKGQDQTNQKLDQTNKRLENLETTVSHLSTQTGENTKAILKLTVQTQENTRAIIKLADKLDAFSGYEDRIKNLEKAVYKS